MRIPAKYPATTHLQTNHRTRVPAQKNNRQPPAHRIAARHIPPKEKSYSSNTAPIVSSCITIHSPKSPQFSPSTTTSMPSTRPKTVKPMP